METPELVALCRRALEVARSAVASLGDRGTVEVHGEHVVDISTRGDLAVSEALTRFFAENAPPAVLYSEESGRLELGRDPRLTIAFDDIDGTDNYHRGRELLPHCTVVTLFDSPTPDFGDALVAAVLEHRTGTTWEAVRGGGCRVNDRTAQPTTRTELDRRTLVIVDHYVTGRELPRLTPLYPEVWVKDYGSAALHLVGISSGLFDAYLAAGQKAHELGAGCLLIEEAGGCLTDWSGASLTGIPYDFGGRYPVVAAGNAGLHRALLERLSVAAAR